LSQICSKGKIMTFTASRRLPELRALHPAEIKKESPNVFYMVLSDRRVKVFFEKNIKQTLIWALKVAKFDVIFIGPTGTAQLHSIAAENYHDEDELDLEAAVDRAEKLERQSIGKIISCITDVVGKDPNVEVLRWKSAGENAQTPEDVSPSRFVVKINHLLEEMGEPLVDHDKETKGAYSIDSKLLNSTNKKVAGLAGTIKGIESIRARNLYPPKLPDEKKPFFLQHVIDEALTKKRGDGKTRIIILPLEVITGKMMASNPNVTSSLWSEHDALEINHLYGQENKSKEFILAQEVFLNTHFNNEQIRIRFNEICNIHAEKRMNEEFKPEKYPTIRARMYNYKCTRNFFWWESAYFLMWLLTAMTMKIPIYVGYPFPPGSEKDSIFQIPLLIGEALGNNHPELFNYINLTSLMPDKIEPFVTLIAPSALEIKRKEEEKKKQGELKMPPTSTALLTHHRHYLTFFSSCYSYSKQKKIAEVSQPLKYGSYAKLTGPLTIKPTPLPSILRRYQPSPTPLISRTQRRMT
jgi:hypothetical protein